jgi:hypothetical protein
VVRTFLTFYFIKGRYTYVSMYLYAHVRLPVLCMNFKGVHMNKIWTFKCTQFQFICNKKSINQSITKNKDIPTNLKSIPEDGYIIFTVSELCRGLWNVCIISSAGISKQSKNLLGTSVHNLCSKFKEKLNTDNCGFV